MINDTTLIVLTICAVLWIISIVMRYSYDKEVERAKKDKALENSESNS